MQKLIVKSYEELSKIAADIFAVQIRKNPESTLGLATGGTPVGMYKELVRMHREENLDFSRIVTFNLDEYYPIKKSHAQSYDYFMRDNLFNHINIKNQNIHLPNGESADPDEECRRYECSLRKAQVDIQLLGIGRNGHIAFNEPDEELFLETHVTDLTESTVDANARFFDKKDDVPRKALTMGIGSIMRAKEIVMLISGSDKAEISADIFNRKLTSKNPASFLQLHPNVMVIIDEPAARLL